MAQRTYTQYFIITGIGKYSRKESVHVCVCVYIYIIYICKCVSVYNLITLLYIRNYHSIVNQLSFNFKKLN